MKESNSRLDSFLADELKPFSTQRVCVKGDPSRAIVEAAKGWGPDLVMMPTHGLGVFRRLLLGSVTSKVLDDLDCPVWTSVHTEAAPRLEDVHCRRILCAVDLAERSRSVLEWAAWLAGQYQATLGAVHAITQSSIALSGSGAEESVSPGVVEHTKRMEILGIAPAAASHVFVRFGDPAKVVAWAARGFEADLLVMGRHGGGGIGGFLRPNAYSIFRESPCPTISI